MPGRHFSSLRIGKVIESTGLSDVQPYGCTLVDVLDAPYRALSDRTRRIMVEELADGDKQTLYELCVRLTMKHGIDMTRQAVRKHLGILEACGFVTTQQKGKYQLITFTGNANLAIVRQWLDHVQRRK